MGCLIDVVVLGIFFTVIWIFAYIICRLFEIELPAKPLKVLGVLIGLLLLLVIASCLLGYGGFHFGQRWGWR